MIWTNWSGTVECQPRFMERPASEDDVAALVRRVSRDGESLRVAGSGHSFAPLCATDGLLLSLDNLRGLIGVDRAACEATIWAGSKISGLGEPLREVGLGLENQGDVDYQALAGAISTGTHGTGLRFGSLSSCVAALRLVLASGEVVTVSPEADSELFKAAQVSLGALGVITRITMRLAQAYRLHERTWVASVDEALEQLDALISGNEHFEFFWLPEHDAAVMKALNSTTDEPTGTLPPPVARPGTLERYIRPERVDWSYRIYPSERIHRFVEMEYAVPLVSGPDCFRELRAMMRAEHPQALWAVEYRTQCGDDIFLSPVYQRDSVTISIHETVERPHQAFFAAAEAIFRNYGGRPHWGKVHGCSARELSQLYPMWERFQAIRDRLDPAGRFLNPHLRHVLVDG